MSRISRESFVEGAKGQGLDVNALDSDTKQAIQEAGLTESELKSLAGKDGIISGKDELGKLFDYIDKADRNGSYRSIDTTRQEGGKELATRSGELHEALTSELERARLGPPPGAAPGKTDVAGKAERKPPEGRIAKETAPATTAQRDLAIATLTQAGFTDIHLASNTPYFNQAGGDWGQRSYPKNPPEKDDNGNLKRRTFQEAGCAPSALAMADVALRGSKSTPLTVGQFAVDKNFSGKPGVHGSDAHGMGKAWAEEHGLRYTPATRPSARDNVDIVREGLKSGGVAVIGVGVDKDTRKGHFTAKGHIMVVNGYAKDKDGREWFFVVNPGRNDQRDGKVLKTDANVVQDRSLHHGAGQLRISREQLEKEMKHAYVLHNQAD
jgi:hypothetical protein